MYQNAIESICRLALRRPFAWLAVIAILSIPAYLEVQKIRVDTNLKRLLPAHSQAVYWSQEMEGVTGDGGYFSVLFEGDDPEALHQALLGAAHEIEALAEVRTVEYERPLSFIQQYRYTLLDSHQLEGMLDQIYDMQAAANPLVEDLSDDSGDDSDDPSAESQAEQDKKDAERRAMVARYARDGRFNESDDGRVVGMIVRTSEGIGNLGSLRRLSGKLEAISASHAAPAGLWSGVAGNLRNRVAEYDQIMGDLQRAGSISLLAIVVTLLVSFRSLRVLPVLVLPLGVGLLWSFALVPFLVGDLNTITSFLLMVLFGMGIDYAIHLVKRFQVERLNRSLDDALRETFLSTGRSVLTSGLTTALGLAILAISDFRGFSDFGRIGGSAMVMVVASMFLVLPPVLVAASRWSMVPAQAARSGKGLIPPSWVGVGLLILVVVSAVAAKRHLAFDYDFSNLSAQVDSLSEVKQRHSQVYRGVSAPAAIYVARDLATLDSALSTFHQAAQGSDPTIGAVTSIRNLAPTAAEMEQRLELVDEMKDALAGRWVDRVKDSNDRKLIDDFRGFEPPRRAPSVNEVPELLSRRLIAKDGSGELVIGVDTAGRSKDGLMAMAFTRSLYDLELPEGVRGPTGDKPVLAEILWLVTGESPLIIGLTFAGIFLIVLLDLRTFIGTLWVLFPLVAGLLLSLGAMVALGMKLNFFNMVVLPTMLGVGVDHGVHYYRRWRELGRDTRAAHAELFEPLTVCSVTTVMGYVGMNLAHHPGLLAIGRLAIVGLTCGWVAALLLFPVALRWRERSLARAAGVTTQVAGEPAPAEPGVRS